MKRNGLRDGYGLTLWFSIAGLLVAFVVSVWCYRKVFGGPLSLDPNYWSTFGTYFSGIFSPLVSFVTLIAILKTIKLQSTLLETQSREFSVMQDIQTQTLVSQQELADRALRDSERQEIESFRNNLLAMLDRYMAQAQARLASTIERMDRLAQWVLDGKAGNNRAKDLEGISLLVDGIRKEITDLNVLMIEINFDEFTSSKEMRTFFHKNIHEVFSASAKATHEAAAHQAAPSPPI